jgi:hypothetical protein
MRTKVLVLFLFFLLFVLQVLAQQHFPKSWEGKYEGNLQIFGVDSVRMEVLMKLEIYQKTDSLFSWNIIYSFNGNIDERNYELKLVDALKGLYEIDEKNSIIIPSSYKFDIFTSFFEVSENFIVATYTKRDNNIVFEIISADKTSFTETGNTNFQGQEIPLVTSFYVTGRQRAVLTKQN